jgi:O-Antigen ligase
VPVSGFETGLSRQRPIGAAASKQPRHGRFPVSTRNLVILFGAHVLLGVLLTRVSFLADLHCFIVVVAGILLAMFGSRIQGMILSMGYIVGAEVLWRMSESSLPYEVGKYAIAVISCYGLFRMGTYRIPREAVLYILLLVPATLITIYSMSGVALRQTLSFTLSGPISLVSAACFFSNVTLTRDDLKELLLSIALPIAGITSAAVFGLATAKDLAFGTESVHAASGGFGPNQVSAVLGLGFLMALHYILLPSKSVSEKAVVFTVMMAFIGQAALTFSRGGVVGAFTALLPAMYFMFRDARNRMRTVAWLALVVAVSGLVLYPAINDFTGGALNKRYQKDLSGREGLMSSDLAIWADNPVFGIGTGLSTFGHAVHYGRFAATHNEFTRLLAEHGMFGLAAALLVFWMAARAILRSNTPAAKAFATSMVTWSVFFVTANGMRIAAAGFIFGLAMVHLRPAHASFSRIRRTL